MQNKLTTFGAPIGALILLILMIMWQAGSFNDKIEPGVIPAQKTYHGKTLTLSTEDIGKYTVYGQKYLTTFIIIDFHSVCYRMSKVHFSA